MSRGGDGAEESDAPRSGGANAGRTADDGLAAVVEKPRAEAAIESLRAEGVYDDGRRVRPHGDGTVALPVTERPAETTVRSVVSRHLPPRVRGLDDLLSARGWTDAELERAPGSWAVVGSVVLVDAGEVSGDGAAFPRPREVGEALLELHGEADTVLARGGVSGPRREPDVTVLAGEGDTETIHTEHGTRYAMDLARVMFSPGNQAERVRMGRVVAPDERVFDVFAGVGYFALPMARAGAAVTTAEVNPVAYRYQVENAVLNGVEDRLSAYRAGCDAVADLLADEPVDRAVMGHFDAHEHLDAALSALAAGGVVHLHAATPEASLWERPLSRLRAAAAARDREVEPLARRVVKSYSEGVRHVVVDARVT